MSLGNKQRKHPVAFHIMTKPRSAICNLDCAYCYYLSKEVSANKRWVKLWSSISGAGGSMQPVT